MNYGLRKGLEDIAYELKGIKNILACLWHTRYANEETDLISPDLFADEYISTEECARRLGVSDQTVRNWILSGRKNPERGWTYGVHYINVETDIKKRQTIRIPWNRLIQTFTKGLDVSMKSFSMKRGDRDESVMRDQRMSRVPNPEVEKTEDFEDGFIQGY
jgi:hypothetical protein